MDNLGEPRYTEVMSARSAMIYLRALRDLQGLSRPALERISGLPQKQIYRWEQQEDDKLPDVAELGKWARSIRASFAHLEVLLQEDDLSEAAIRAMAEDRWEELQNPDAPGVQESIDLIARLRAHPVLLGRWIEYGERLLSSNSGNR